MKVRLLLGLVALGGTVAASPPASPVAASTSEMAAILKERAAKVDLEKLALVVNDRRADMIAAQLEFPRPIMERLQLRRAYAIELLGAGRNPESLEAIDALEADAKTNAPALLQGAGAELLVLRAMANLRMAEEQNCHEGNNRDSCLLPIRGQGVHRRREGSTRATRLLEQALVVQPENLTARWLLNVAHMTLGSYPEGVPPAHLIPPATFGSDYPLPRFENVANAVGLDVYALAGGAILDDFDNDGRLDLLLSAQGFEDPIRFFYNKGDGSFEERTERIRLEGVTGGLNMIQADYDNDGFVDVLVLRGGWLGSEGRFPLSLLRNQGDGTFADVTRAAGLLRFAPTQTAVWLDFDGDGWLDLYVGNESLNGGRDPATLNRSELYRSNRDGTFTNVAREAGVDVVGLVKAVVSGDYNNDGRPDLYVSLNDGDNLLFRNDGPPPPGERGWRFTNVAAEAGVLEPKASFGAFFFDYDNDGSPDLFVAGYSWTTAGDVAADYLGLPTAVDRGRLYHNRGDGTFEDATKAAGVYKVIPAMGLNFGDLDNDGFLDFYLGTGNPELATLVPNRMFRNAEGRFFQDVTTAGNFGHLQKGHGICFGDVDNDGDQDVFEEMGGALAADKAWSVLYENPGNANQWLTLELEGVRSNRSAIGARIKVTVEGKKGLRSIYRTVGSGGSFGGSPLRQEIGLGDAARVASVEVFWPGTGRTQKIQGLEIKRRYRVREGVDAAVRLDRPAFKLSAAAKRDASQRAR